MTVRVVKREGGVYHFVGCGGDSITNNIQEVIEKLKELEAEGQQVKGVLTFNGLELNLLHNTDPALALIVWNSACEKRHAEYIASPEYQQQQEASALRAVAAQKNMDTLVAEIKKILIDWAAVHGGSDIQPNGEIALRLMVLFKEYIEEADSIHIESYSKDILPLLEAAGYKENEFTKAYGNPAPVKQYETRAWFVGQMINMLKSHGCAHPGLAHMVVKYKLHLNP